MGRGVKASGGGEGGAEDAVTEVISLELSLLAGLLLSSVVAAGDGSWSCDWWFFSTSEGDTTVQSSDLLLLWLDSDRLVLLLLLVLSIMEGRLTPGLFLLLGSCDVDIGGSSSNLSGWSGCCCCCSLGGLKCCENMIWTRGVSARAKVKR